MNVVSGKLAEKIVVTLAYVAQFKFPLTLEEIARRMVGGPWPVAEIKAALEELIDRGVVETRDGYYWLAKAGSSSWVEQRQHSEVMSQFKRVALRPLLRVVEWLPWVRSVWVTGSVAVGGARKTDDTDLLIISLPGTLWLSRIILTVYSWATGRLRRFDSEVKHQSLYQSWCFNLWLTPKSWVVEPHARTLYTAYEVLQADCVFDRDGHQWWFVQVNDWVRHYLPRWYGERVGQFEPELLASRLPWRYYHVWLWWWRCLDWFAYVIQRLYMWRHMTRERVGREFAFFHPRDTRRQINEGWRAALRALR